MARPVGGVVVSGKGRHGYSGVYPRRVDTGSRPGPAAFLQGEKTMSTGFRVSTLVFLFLLSAIAPLAADEEPRWPRELEFDDGTVIVVFQPQVVSWEDNRRLAAWVAFSAKLMKSEKPELGALRVEVDTDVDMEARMVSFANLKITKIKFPGLSSGVAKATESVVRRYFPTEIKPMELDRILANLDNEPPARREVKLSTRPPKVFVSRREAILVLLDGEPMLEPVPGTRLRIVVNTDSNLLRLGEDGAYYLLVGESWITASGLEGPWASVNDLPADFGKLPDNPRFKEVRANVPGKPLSVTDLPEVFVSKEPAELLVSVGEPRFKPIPGTRLLYVANTEADVFLHADDGLYYVLLSGRWYKTEGKDLPLEYAGDDLPEDFKKIPPGHTCGRVLANVPGTGQAREAALAAQIPRTARVKRSEAKLDVTYEGEPKFERIEGTEVDQAVNTSLDVFRVKDRYYACYEGVWFASESPTGPWALCDKVPEAIYRIPSTSDKYPVTYVNVYESDPESVVYGYWPGYYGVYYYHGCLWYGTGYWYPRARWYWYHRHHWWCHHPCGFHWYRRTWGRGYYYDHLSGRYRADANARRHLAWRGHGVSPYRTWPARAVQPGRYPAARDVKRDPMGRPVTAAGRTSPSAWDRSRTARGSGDIYAGRQGGLYRRGKSGGWQRYENGRWTGTDLKGPLTPQPKKPAAAAGQSRPGAKKATPRHPKSATPRSNTRPKSSQPRANRHDSLDRSYQSRHSGAERRSQYRSYRNSRGSRSSAYRGGGARGGGFQGGGRGGGRR